MTQFNIHQNALHICGRTSIQQTRPAVSQSPNYNVSTIHREANISKIPLKWKLSVISMLLDYLVNSKKSILNVKKDKTSQKCLEIQNSRVLSMLHNLSFFCNQVQVAYINIMCFVLIENSNVAVSFSCFNLFLHGFKVNLPSYWK